MKLFKGVPFLMTVSARPKFINLHLGQKAPNGFLSAVEARDSPYLKSIMTQKLFSHFQTTLQQSEPLKVMNREIGVSEEDRQTMIKNMIKQKVNRTEMRDLLRYHYSDGNSKVKMYFYTKFGGSSKVYDDPNQFIRFNKRYIINKNLKISFDSVQNPVIIARVYISSKKRLAPASFPSDQDQLFTDHMMQLESNSNQIDWTLTDIDSNIYDK